MKFSVSLVCFVVVAALFGCAQCSFENLKVGMPAPKLLYSCTVENNLNKPIEVEVSYTHPFENRVVVDRATLAAGEHKFFDRRTFVNIDDATYAAGITGVVVKDAVETDKTISLGKSDFKIYSPTANYRIHVVPSDDPVGFEFQHSAAM